MTSFEFLAVYAFFYIIPNLHNFCSCAISCVCFPQQANDKQCLKYHATYDQWHLKQTSNTTKNLYFFFFQWQAESQQVFKIKIDVYSKVARELIISYHQMPKGSSKQYN